MVICTFMMGEVLSSSNSLANHPATWRAFSCRRAVQLDQIARLHQVCGRGHAAGRARWLDLTLARPNGLPIRTASRERLAHRRRCPSRRQECCSMHPYLTVTV